MSETLRSGKRRRGNGARLVQGLALLAVGALLLAGNLGYAVPHRLWRYWPFLLIALGAARLVAPGEREPRGGYWLVIVGVYGWINEWHLFGLDWGSSWPIFLIAAGLLMLFDGGRWRRREGGDAGGS